MIAFGAPVDKIQDHPVGIDLERFPFIIRTPPAQGPIKILTVSRLVKEKGLGLGLEAIHQLVYERSLTNIEYNILGDGPLRDELQHLAHKLEIKNKVHFLGSQTQEGVIRILRDSHIFFLPSIAEALPVVLMEAQATGLPVLATDVGSVRQVMVDGKSGYIVPSEDVMAMCDKLESLLRNPQSWPLMGEAGRQHTEERYDIKKLNKRLVQICEGLLEHTS